jgi:hypothetical protein
MLQKKTCYKLSCLRTRDFKRFRRAEEHGNLTKHVILIFRNGTHIWYFCCQPELYEYPLYPCGHLFGAGVR